MDTGSLEMRGDGGTGPISRARAEGGRVMGGQNVGSSGHGPRRMVWGDVGRGGSLPGGGGARAGGRRGMSSGVSTEEDGVKVGG